MLIAGVWEGFLSALKEACSSVFYLANYLEVLSDFPNSWMVIIRSFLSNPCLICQLTGSSSVGTCLIPDINVSVVLQIWLRSAVNFFPSLVRVFSKSDCYSIPGTFIF